MDFVNNFVIPKANHEIAKEKMLKQLAKEASKEVKAFNKVQAQEREDRALYYMHSGVDKSENRVLR